MINFGQAWTEIRVELAVLFEQAGRWFADLSNAEKLLGVCAVIMLFFLLVLRRSGDRKHNRTELFQFLFAMTLVVFAGFGVGWFFDPNFAR